MYLDSVIQKCFVFFTFPVKFLLLCSQFLHIDTTRSHIELCIRSNPELQLVIFPQAPENKQKLNRFVFLFCQYKYTFHLDFWLCACAFSTLTTIFCSSIRKARLILKGKEHLFRTQHPKRRYRHTLAAASPVTHTLGAHGASVSSADMLLGFGEPHEDLRSNSSDLQERTTIMRPQQELCAPLDRLRASFPHLVIHHNF